MKWGGGALWSAGMGMDMDMDMEICVEGGEE